MLLLQSSYSLASLPCKPSGIHTSAIKTLFIGLADAMLVSFWYVFSDWVPHTGLMTLAAAKSFGATSLAITDISPQNIALAKKMGATEAYCHPRTATPQEIADYLKKMLSPYGPEIIIDCVGFESTVQTAIRSCCMGGKVVVVGMGQDNMTLPMSTVGVHELDVLGCFRYANTVSSFDLGSPL